MKLISLLAFFASLVTAVVLPVRFEIAASLFLAAALAALLQLDYAGRRPLRLPTSPHRSALRRARLCHAKFRAPALALETHRLAA